MKPTVEDRIAHILEAIADIERLLDGKTVGFVADDRIAKAAYERLLEIVSEASRYIPVALRTRRHRFPGGRSPTSAIGSDMVMTRSASTGFGGSERAAISRSYARRS